MTQLRRLWEAVEYIPHTSATSELFSVGWNKLKTRKQNKKNFTYMKKGFCFIFVLSVKYPGHLVDKSYRQMEMTLEAAREL